MTYMDPTGLAPYVNGVYDGPYDPDHQAPEVTYGPEYKSGTPSESAHSSAPTVGTSGNEEALRQYENKEIGLVEYWSKLDFKSLFSDSLKELKSDVAEGINDTKDSFIDFYNENGVKGIAGAVLGMLSPVNVQEEEIVDPATGKLTTIQTVCPCFPFLLPGATGDSIFAAGKEGRFSFDARAGRYRDLSTGRFAAAADLPWPGNRGFAGNPVDTALRKGTIIDRFGSLEGRYAGVPGQSISARGMALGSEGMAYTRLEVLKPLTVPGGTAAGVPAFGASGGGTQYFFRGGIQSWIDRGYLRIIP